MSGGEGSVLKDKRKGETDEEWKKRGGTWKTSVGVPCPPTCGCKKRHQRLRRGFATKKGAQKDLTQHLEKVNTKRYASPMTMTVERFLVDHWLPHLAALPTPLSPSTLNGYRTDVERVLPYIGDINLQDLDRHALNDMYSELSVHGSRKKGAEGGPLSANTVRGTHTVLGIAMDWALYMTWVPHNVVRDAKPPTPKEAEPEPRQVWNLEQMIQFFDEIEGSEHAVIIRLLSMTGLRRSEICGLRWSDVDLRDLDEASISVNGTTLSVRAQLVDWRPKSENSKRTFLIDPDTAEILRQHRVRQVEWFLQRGQPMPDHDRVFVGPRGGVTKPDTITQAFSRLVEKSTLPRITLHDLRHSHATQWADETLLTLKDVKAMTARFGHSTEAFTLKRYVKVNLRDQAAPLGRLTAKFRAARGDGGPDSPPTVISL